MRHYLPYFYWVVFSIISFTAHGQISVDFPSDRAVFQRDKSNNANLHIAGSYTKPVDRVEAKVSALVPGQGSDKDWTTLSDASIQGGFFSGYIPVQGGWYRLEVRGWKGGQLVDTKSVDHVGIGEVFLIAGQSNAQGFNDGRFNNQGAQDDRVNSINNYEIGDYPFELPERPSFHHVDAQSSISPRGPAAWCWGRLGDRLAARLNVPILFFNTGWTGMASRNWKESINGNTMSVYAPVWIQPDGMPYGNFRNVIQRYTPITGLRGVLWLQGEADNFKDTPTDRYFDELKTIIETSRNESGKNISWMVSITSYDDDHGSDSQVTDGQRRVILNVPNVFEGPNTDLIQVPRLGFDNDGAHFWGDGLIQLGDAWANSLTDDFFARSEPYQAQRPLRITANCAGNGNITITADPVGLNSFSWNNGQSSSSVVVGNGTYYVKARDDRGNYIFSPEIRVNEQIQPNQPTVTIEGSNPVCLGNTATLVSSTADNAVWNTGATGDRLPVTAGGEYFVTVKNIYGCEASSQKVAMQVLNSPLPDKPKITASGAITFCQGGEVNLISDSKVKSVWSNGANNATITVVSSGDYRVKALDDVGCFSPESDPISVKVNPLPEKPVIALSGETTFCDGGNVTMTSNYDSGNIWSTNATTKAIAVTTTGKFTLKQRDGNGCESTSDEVNVKVNALPATPTVTALRPTTFCERDYTTLRSSEAYNYQWSNGSTDREIEIRASGNFTISAKDENGCVSPVSPVVAVVMNPLPSTPVITADGPTTFCADLSVQLTSTTATGYLWSDGSSQQSLKVTVAGTYSVQTINQFQCYSDPSNQISTQTLALPSAPEITARQATTFCDGDTIVLKAANGSAFFWNNGLEGDSIEVFATGSYSARIQDQQGCYSPYSAPVPVDVKPSPSVPVIRQTGVYTLFAENNLNAGEHVWKYNNSVLTETSATLKAVKAGNYVVNNTIVYSETLTCYSDFSEPFLFYLDTNNPGFVAYPNPNASDKVTIEAYADLVNADVQIIDSRGVIHRTFRVQKFDRPQYFNLTGLSSGIYIIRINSPALNATQKLVIVR
ncbi:T9SS type A sorting domain-containing protein [Dyadobacter soli]|nr:sialate O-acetylesterase [Dyadobacter soli]